LLFVQLVFAAVTRFVFVIFVAAIANARELFAASRAFHTVEICIFIDADGVAARGAFHFDEIIVVAATAVAIVIIAIAAVTVVAVEFFFESAEIFVDFFDIGFKVFGIFLETADRICDIAENVKNSGNYLIITVKTFCKTFDISNFFRNVHGIIPTLSFILQRWAA
jgi:hypothetical protein